MTALMAQWVSALLIAALLVPSANLQVFDGLPLSHLPEFVGLVLLLPVLASRSLRRLYARQLRRCGPRVTRSLLAAGALALSVKLVLLATGVHAGFLACYQTPLSRARGSCEHSFENPFWRFDATRLDRHLDFGPDNWNLGFFNSLRVNTPLFYFPRHIVAGYLSMGLVACYVASGRGAREPGR
jgi:hypothetical protein